MFGRAEPGLVQQQATPSRAEPGSGWLVSTPRFNAPPRKPFFLFCGEDKGHTTRTCHHTINKKKELASSAAQLSQLKEVFNKSLYYSPYVPQYVQPQSQEPRLHLPSVSNASKNLVMSVWLPFASFVQDHLPMIRFPWSSQVCKARFAAKG
jgi:hypothetical protein